MDNIPNKAFDIEYSTMWGREMKFLLSKGIRYTFVKKTKDYSISVYKYKKTSQLFNALSEFFTQIENEKSLAEAQKAMQNAIEVRTPEDLEKAMQILGLKVVIENGQPKFVKETDDTI